MKTATTLLCDNPTNAAGIVTGGQVDSLGLAIRWQRGPLLVNAEDGEPCPNRNGALLETVLEACSTRLEAFQKSPMRCDENAEALASIQSAIEALGRRAERRKAEGIADSHQPERPRDLDAENE